MPRMDWYEVEMTGPGGAKGAELVKASTPWLACREAEKRRPGWSGGSAKKVKLPLA